MPTASGSPTPWTPSPSTTRRCRRRRSARLRALVQGHRDRQGRPCPRLGRADPVVEGDTGTGHQEQLYIETNGVIAVPWIEQGPARRPRRTPGTTVYGSLQCPYYVHRALVVALGLPPGQVRVVQTETGGGFGGKEEYPSMLACHAAILAAQGRRAGEDDLRPGRGSAGHDQAAPVDRPRPHRRGRRRPADRDGRRRGDGRRRLLHAQPGGALARRDPRHRSVPLRSRPHPRPGDDDPHPAQRRVPRLRRAADAVRRRGAPRPRRRDPRPRSAPHPRP